jgi:hypothetical protein
LVTVKVTLNADPERTVIIPITTTDQDGASSADYSGVPASVTFNADDTEVDINFSASSDSVDDDGEASPSTQMTPRWTSTSPPPRTRTTMMGRA